MDELDRAADTADAFLVSTGAGDVVLRDPTEVWVDDKLFAFTRASMPVDDQVIVVDRATGVASFVHLPPWEPNPLPNLRPVDDSPEVAPG